MDKKSVSEPSPAVLGVSKVCVSVWSFSDWPQTSSLVVLMKLAVCTTRPSLEPQSFSASAAPCGQSSVRAALYRRQGCGTCSGVCAPVSHSHMGSRLCVTDQVGKQSAVAIHSLKISGDLLVALQVLHMVVRWRRAVLGCPSVPVVPLQ